MPCTEKSTEAAGSVPSPHRTAARGPLPRLHTHSVVREGPWYPTVKTVFSISKAAVIFRQVHEDLYRELVRNRVLAKVGIL